MRPIPALLALFALAPTSCARAGAVSVGARADVLDYHFAITISDASDEIRGVADVTLALDLPCISSSRGPGLQVQDCGGASFVLNLVARGDSAKGMVVDSVSFAPTGEAFSSARFEHAGDALTVYGVGVGPTTGRLRVRYHGTPADGLIISRNAYRARTFFGDNWPNRARHWLPTVDHPSDKATVTWDVTAPSGYRVVANGRAMGATCGRATRETCRSIYRSDVPIPTKVMVFGAAPFAVETVGAVRGVPVESWVFEQERANGFREYARALPVLAYYDSLIAPYPFEKLANVQSKTRYGGMENAGAIFYNEDSAPGDGSSEGLIAHEIVHQWFGNSATEADWPHLWLSEGFATYLTNVYFEHTKGEAHHRADMTRQREQVLDFWRRSPAPLVDTVYADPNELLNTNPYQRGAWVLHMLRARVGDARFFEGVRHYYLRHERANATTDSLRVAFEAVTGDDLRAFFEQWTRRAGQPRLETTWRYDAPAREVVLTLRQRQPGAPFTFPLDIAVGDAVHTVEVDAMSETFRLSAAARPSSLALDPRVRLLFEDGGVRETSD